MSVDVQAEVVRVRDENTGEILEAVVIPEGYIACLMAREDAARYAEWTEAKAVRIAVDDDSHVRAARGHQRRGLGHQPGGNLGAPSTSQHVPNRSTGGL